MIDWHVWKGHFLISTWEVRLHQKKARGFGGHCRVSKLGMCLIIAPMEHTRSPKGYVPSLRTASTLPGKYEAERQGQLFLQSFTLCKFMTCDFIIPRCYVPHCTHNSKAKLLEASLPAPHSVRVLAFGSNFLIEYLSPPFLWLSRSRLILASSRFIARLLDHLFQILRPEAPPTEVCVQ
jgi:hypothetical protein